MSKVQEQKNKSCLHVFTENKKFSLLLANSYNRLKKDNKYWKVYHCGDFLEFKQFRDGNLKLNWANFCKDRLCPQCAKRRSLKVFGQLSLVLEELKKEEYRYLFITLTIKNCNSEDLANTIDLLNLGVRKFHRNRYLFRGVNPKFCGFFKAMELTRNHTRNDWHPHLHFLVAVKKDYFKNVLTQNELAEIWQECLGLDYKPIVDIRAVKKLKGAKCELSKYITKSSDYIVKDNEKLTDYIVSCLSESLFNKRFISYQGCFFKARKRLKLKEIDDDLINIETLDKSEELDYIIKTFRWNMGLSAYEEFDPNGEPQK